MEIGEVESWRGTVGRDHNASPRQGRAELSHLRNIHVSHRHGVSNDSSMAAGPASKTPACTLLPGPKTRYFYLNMLLKPAEMPAVEQHKSGVCSEEMNGSMHHPKVGCSRPSIDQANAEPRTGIRSTTATRHETAIATPDNRMLW